MHTKLQQGRINAVLDRPVAYYGQETTRRALVEAAVRQGLLFTPVMVMDTAAKKRDEAAVAACRRAGYLMGLSNPNIPTVKKALEADARLKANDYYTKPEYRQYLGAKQEGPFREITAIEYGYALELSVAQVSPI